MTGGGRTWASHPSHAMRERLAHYMSHGFEIDELGTTSAVVSRPKRWTRGAWLLLNPFYILYYGRRDRRDRIRLTLGEGDSVTESRDIAEH